MIFLAEVERQAWVLRQRASIWDMTSQRDQTLKGLVLRLMGRLFAEACPALWDGRPLPCVWA